MKISESRRRILKRVWIGVMACVVIGSLLPASSPPIRELDLLEISDKVIHFSAYLVLSILPVASFADRRKGILSALLMILLGVLLEGGQWFSPGRSVDLRDAEANMLGVLSGILVGLRLR